jgi:hypothetical protein
MDRRPPRSLWRQRFAAPLVGFFATLAALIASAGLYAVMSYAVANRRVDLGYVWPHGADGPSIAITVSAVD